MQLVRTAGAVWALVPELPLVAVRAPVAVSARVAVQALAVALTLVAVACLVAVAPALAVQRCHAWDGHDTLRT